jgi:two-component system, NarL family, nitrate/nitrite response regulator NarL
MNMLNDAPVQVHLVAPPLVCWGLQRLIQTAGAQFILVGCSSTLSEAMPLLERQSPDLIVLDFDDGYTVEDISQLYASQRFKVLALTCDPAAGLLHDLLEAGARGVLQKREGPAALLKAIELVGNGDVYVTPGTATAAAVTAATNDRIRVRVRIDSGHRTNGARDAESRRLDALTLRERQTFAAVMSDAASPVKVIADRLCISEHTLRNHLTSIYSKLGVSGRLALYAYASENHLSGHADAFRAH